MKAAVLFETKKPLVIEEIALRKPKGNEVIIKTAASGLCHSDLHFIDGELPYPLPVVLGHEASGIVEMIGDNVTYVKPGDHVITCLSVFCGVCDNCTTGKPYICADEKVKMLPGQADRLFWDRPEQLHTGLNLSGFAENMLVHENALVKIRKDMPVGLSVTLRKTIMKEFYDRLVNIAMPRIKDFRGFSKKSFDGQGNITIGIRDHIIFPEISVENVENVFGFDITIVTSANNNKEGYELLKLMNFPFLN